MKILGLTGDIACGKSTVAQMLAERGAVHLDADHLVHELYADPDFGRRVVALFVDKFGGNIVTAVQNLLDENGAVNRPALGQLVFGDAQALRRLEALVHPAVAALRVLKLEWLRRQDNPPPVVVMEAVKLIESGQARDCDAVWCVACSEETQMRRLMQERGLDEAAARIRLRAQPTLAEKRAAWGALPLVLLHNDGTREQLAAQVEAAWARLMNEAA